MTQEFQLCGRTALVTGVSRRRGIGFAIAKRLAGEGANLFIGHWAPHDDRQPWGSDDLDAVRLELQGALVPGAVFGDLSIDLADPAAPEALIQAALGLTGQLDILVCNQARSGSDGALIDARPAMLDGHYAVNARATVLMTSAFARAFNSRQIHPCSNGSPRQPARPGDISEPIGEIDEHATGRVMWITSGQARPMPGEVAYAMSKAALAGLVPTAAAELLRYGVLLNAINPGPVNTGYLDADSTDRSTGVIDDVLAMMPLGRFSQPDDVARLVAWLAGEDGRWVAGQVINSDSGFSL